MMITHDPNQTQVLLEANVWRKLEILPGNLQNLLSAPFGTVPETPGRDVQTMAVSALPDKKGLSSREGQARLLHDLASIELQAMEIGVRTLLEFPLAPAEFRQELADITHEEGQHLRLCLEGLEALEMPWGSFPVHTGLWQCLRSTDSLLDRVVIVNRYLEGAGLDASHTLLQRLAGVRAADVLRAVRVISQDEIRHVLFGSHWYRRLVTMAGRDPEDDFRIRIRSLADRIPRRLEPIRSDLRRLAGFTESELTVLEEIRMQFKGKNP